MALEDLTATAQHFRNAGFTNLDIGALFIAQALDRIADALEAGGGMQGPADQPQLPPWITDHLPTESVASNGWVQVHAGGIFASFANGDRGRIKPWNAVATGEAWAPLYLTEAFIYHAPDAMPWQGFLPAPSAPAGDDVEAGLQAMAPEPSATPAAPKVAPGPDWITHRVPTYEDADEDGEVQILTPPVPGERRQPIHVQWASVYPGTPWHPG